MRDNISPEEKLLKLIRGEKKPGRPAVVPAVAPAPQPQKVILPLLKKNPFLSSMQLRFAFLTPKKILTALFALSCLYLTISFIYPWVALEKIRLPKIKAEKINEARAKEEPKPYEYYVQGIPKRQLFVNPAMAGQEGGAAAAMINVDLIRDISLVGIISGEPAQAVIEDKKNQKTVYVNKGQFIGDFQLEDIKEGKVILNYKGQMYELYL